MTSSANLEMVLYSFLSLFKKRDKEHLKVTFEWNI